MSYNPKSNAERAVDGWQGAPPRWVALLAAACDRGSQSEVANRLGKSSGYVSRLINNRYPGDLGEAERLVLSTYAADRVRCPAMLGDAIALAVCIRARRREGPAINVLHRQYDHFCPTCPNNTDIEEDCR